MNPELAKYDIPNNSFVVVGMSRSGTSLLSKLITECIPNAVCVNELIGRYYQLHDAMCDLRRRAMNNMPLPNKYTESGEISDNPHRDLPEMRYEKLPKEFSKNVVVGVKSILSMFDDIDIVLSAGYRVIIVIRDPIYTIGAWNDPVANRMDVAQITDDCLHEWWSESPIVFEHEDKLERQAQIWEHYARKTVSLEGDALVVRYEDLVGNTEDTLVRISEHLNCAIPIDIPVLTSMNYDDRYPPCAIDRARVLVDSMCPSRLKLGYK